MSFFYRLLKNKENESLPTSRNRAPSIFHANPGQQSSDGSGKAIRLPAPIVRDWKRSSMYTRCTYYCLLGFLILLFIGYRYLRYEHSSIWLVCDSHYCKLDITPKGFSKHVNMQFPRTQITLAEAIKTEKDGHFVSSSPRLDDFRDSKTKRSNTARKFSSQKSSYKGPDLNGHYPSFRIGLRNADKSNKRKYPKNDDKQPLDIMNKIDLEPIKHLLEILQGEHAHENEGQEIYSLIFRKFNILQSRRKVIMTSRKIDSYINLRRDKLIVKESGAPCWQSIVCFVFGLIGFLLTLLLGQFWDPQSPRKMNNQHRNHDHNYQRKLRATSANCVTSKSGMVIRSRHSKRQK